MLLYKYSKLNRAEYTTTVEADMLFVKETDCDERVIFFT